MKSDFKRFSDILPNEVVMWSAGNVKGPVIRHLSDPKAFMLPNGRSVSPKIASLRRFTDDEQDIVNKAIETYFKPDFWLKHPQYKKSVSTDRFSPVFELPRQDIRLDPARFQGRQAEYSEDTVNAIVSSGRFDPTVSSLVVWKDPDSGKYFLLSGHSRFEAAKRLYESGKQPSLTSLPVKELLNATEEEAVEYATIESNRRGTEEGLISDLKAYRLAVDSGKNATQLKRLFRPESKLRKLQELSYLNPKGLFVEQLAAPSQQSFPYLERNARWVGDMRRQLPALTNAHERELFDYLYGSKKALNLDKSKFYDLVNNKVNRIDFDPDKALNLNDRISPTAYTDPINEQIRELDKEIDTAQKEIETRRASIARARTEGIEVPKFQGRITFEERIAELNRHIIRLIERKEALRQSAGRLEKNMGGDLFSQVEEKKPLPTSIDNAKATPSQKQLGELYPTIDNRPGNYYVSAVMTPGTWLLLGPFVNDHRSALANVDMVKKVAEKVDNSGRSAFASFGTVRKESTYTKPGKLNDYWAKNHPDAPQPISQVEETPKYKIVSDVLGTAGEPVRFNPHDQVIFTNVNGEEFKVNFRGYSDPAETKAVIVGKSGSGIDQMEVPVSTLRAMDDVGTSDETSAASNPQLFHGITFDEYKVLSITVGIKPAFRAKYFKKEAGINDFEQVRQDLMRKQYLAPSTAITKLGKDKLAEVKRAMGRKRIGSSTSKFDFKGEAVHWNTGKKDIYEIARDLGKEAFEQGKSRAPAQNQALLDLLGEDMSNDHSMNMKLMEEFIRAWDKANLAAPLPTEKVKVNDSKASDNKFNYQMLSRLQSDCDYFLGAGQKNEKHLHQGSVDAQIAEMKRIWNLLPADGKPEWLSMQDILNYETKMKNNDSALFTRIYEYAFSHNNNGYMKNESDFNKVVKEADLKKFQDVGVHDDLIMAFYCGVRSIIDFKADTEVSELEGLFTINDDYIQKRIDKALKICENGAFEMSMKYPDFDWKKIIRKYNIQQKPQLVKHTVDIGKNADEYLYEVFVGDDIAIGQSIGRNRYEDSKLIEEVRNGRDVLNPTVVSKYQKEHERKAGFNGDYWGFVSTDQNILLDILKTCAGQPDGYVKDIEVLINGMGGIDAKVMERKSFFWEGKKRQDKWQKEMDEATEKRFRHLSDQALIDRINKAPDFGWDDEGHELGRRKRVYGIDYIMDGNTISLTKTREDRKAQKMSEGDIKKALKESTVRFHCFFEPVDGPYEAKTKERPSDADWYFLMQDGTAISFQDYHGDRGYGKYGDRWPAYDLYQAMIDPKTWDNKGKAGWVSNMTPQEVLYAMTIKMDADSLELFIDCMRRMSDESGIDSTKVKIPEFDISLQQTAPMQPADVTDHKFAVKEKVVYKDDPKSELYIVTAQMVGNKGKLTYKLEKPSDTGGKIGTIYIADEDELRTSFNVGDDKLNAELQSRIDSGNEKKAHDENAAHYFLNNIGEYYADSNFLNQVEGVMPQTELKHLGGGEFVLVGNNIGDISFYRRSDAIDGFVGRTHRLMGFEKDIVSVIDAMKTKKGAVLVGQAADRELQDASKRKIYDAPMTGSDTCPPMRDGKPDISPEGLQKLKVCIRNETPTKQKHTFSGTDRYTEERKALHQKLIGEFKHQRPCVVDGKPIAVLTGGAPGSGKTHFLKGFAPWMNSDKVYHIDADAVRAKLPEYKGWNADNTHEETSDIVKQMLESIGKPCKHDLVYDGTMNKAKKYLPLVKQLKDMGYEVLVIYLQVPKQVSVSRALERYQRTGRYVPIEVIDEVFDAGLSAYEEVIKAADGYIRVDGLTGQILEKGGKPIPTERDYENISCDTDPCEEERSTMANYYDIKGDDLDENSWVYVQVTFETSDHKQKTILIGEPGRPIRFKLGDHVNKKTNYRKFAPKGFPNPTGLMSVFTDVKFNNRHKEWLPVDASKVEFFPNYGWGNSDSVMKMLEEKKKAKKQSTALAKTIPPGLYIKIGKKKYNIDSFEKLSKAWHEHVMQQLDDHWPNTQHIKREAIIYNSQDEGVGRVSQNGKVWLGADNPMTYDKDGNPKYNPGPVIYDPSAKPEEPCCSSCAKGDGSSCESDSKRTSPLLLLARARAQRVRILALTQT